MIWQLLGGLAYSVAGFVIGFVVGRVTKEVHEIRETVVPQTFAVEDERKPGHAHATKLGVVVIILSMLTIIATAWTGVEAKHNADCQSAYNAKFFEAFQARARANDADRKALNDLILTLGDTTLTPPQRAQAFSTYVEGIRAGNAERAKHPLPMPPDPRQACS